MSDLSPEAAFLASMQGGAYDSTYPTQQPAYASQEDEDDDEDYDPSSLMPDTVQQDAQPESGTASRSLSKSPAALPSQPQLSTAAVESRRSKTTTPVGQPRTRGGFVDDDDDEEDDNEMPEASLTQATGAGGQLGVPTEVSSKSPQRSVSQTPLNATPSLPTPDVYSRAAQDEGTSAPAVDPTPASESASNVASAVPNGVSAPDSHQLAPAQTFSPAPATKTDGAQAAASTAQNTPSFATPKRLPNDRIGMLEDRIKESPQGDMDAWLELLAEYRRRDKVEETRLTYERFLSIFPSAVSMPTLEP